MQHLPLYRKKIITVSDPAKKELVQGLLARHNIEYRMRAKEILQKNPVDTARVGTLGMNQTKITYSFYVDKADVEAAKSLLRSGSL